MAMTSGAVSVHGDPEMAGTVDSDLVASSPKPQRLLSIDVLRGLTIAFMILVNNEPDPNSFHALNHAEWNGFTPTDLVFPTFLFLVGLSLVLSTSARMARGVTRATLFLHMLRRAAVLCAFGLVVNTFPFQHLDRIRYYGVLQRTGLCYLAAGTLCVFWPGWKNKVVIAGLCLAGYWALMRFVPVPGFGVPTHTVAINHPDGNLTAYLDRALFAPQHLYQRVRDPEGLLSTLPAIATTIMGVLAGLWLRTSRETAKKIAGIVSVGMLSVLAGALWNLSFPINKKLWTSSFVLFAGGLSLLLLALAMYLVDVKRFGRQSVSRADVPERPTIYSPLLVFGTNSIAAYMISELLPSIVAMVKTAKGDALKDYATWLHRVVPVYGVPSMLFGLSFVLLTWMLVYPLYRKRIFLRV
ncbi:MAG: acyltransferase family protein [Janthinobacterium lividum]